MQAAYMHRQLSFHLPGLKLGHHGNTRTASSASSTAFIFLNNSQRLGLGKRGSSANSISWRAHERARVILTFC